MNQKVVFAWLLSVNILFIFVFSALEYQQSLTVERVLENETSIVPDNEFIDPIRAYQLLSILDSFEPIDLGLTSAKAEKYYTKGSFLGLYTDKNYCEKHRAYFVKDPSFIFNEKNFITSVPHGSKIRLKVIPELEGNDTMPQIRQTMSDSLISKSLFDIRLDTHAFHLATPYFREVGRHFACLTQVYNHIPGHDDLYRKDRASNAMMQYKKKYESKPHCLDANKFFPHTWLLRHRDQCLDFFEEFNSERYQELKKERKVVYFRKIGYDAHQGSGVFPVKGDEETKLRSQYQDGALCGKVLSNNLMQDYIHNPLLVNGKKVDLRIFIIIASTNPMIVYYNDGYFTVSLADFNANATDKSAFLTNSDVARRYFLINQQKGMFQNMTVKDLWEHTLWSFETFQNYLLGQGLINDTNWLDNYLRPELKKMVVHIIRMSQGSLAKRSSVYEIFGVDLMLDTNFNLWFIEANANPDLEEYPNELDDLLKNMLVDSFEVQFGLLRSRTKRIIAYVNSLIKDEKAWRIDNDQVYLLNPEKRKEEFKKISMNYFEPEFEPPVKARFPKVVDENKIGVEIYNGVLEYDCM